MVAFKTLPDSWAEQAAREREEAERAAEDPGPPLEARPVDGMRDWTKEIGVLYGTPTKTGDGWAVTIYPTRQQDALIDQRRRVHEDGGNYDEKYMEGLPAASVDKQGRTRELTIRDASMGWRYDMDGNINIVCETAARTRVPEPPAKPIQPGGDRTVPTPPARGGNTQRVVTREGRPRPAPAPAR